MIGDLTCYEDLKYFMPMH